MYLAAESRSMPIWPIGLRKSSDSSSNCKQRPHQRGSAHTESSSNCRPDMDLDAVLLERLRR